MSNYVLTQDGKLYNLSDDELMHYGVKGMKWGVRRSIGIRSRAAALYKNNITSVDKKIKKLESKKTSEGLTDRQAEKLKGYEGIKKNFTKDRNSLIKDLSPKDIKRGERAIRARGLLGASRAILDTADLIKADKVMQKNRNRNG